MSKNTVYSFFVKLVMLFYFLTDKYNVPMAEIRKLFNLSSQCLTRKLNMIKKGFFLNKWNSVTETTISNSGKLRNYFQFKCKFGFENYLNLIKILI